MCAQDLKAVIDAAHARNQKVKVIFENCYLQDAHKIRLCEICAELGADWVKTSTGFGTSGATLEDVKLMRAHSPAHVQVKAAGGIRTLDQLLAFRALGASRVGFEPTTSWSRTKRATKLRYAPTRPENHQVARPGLRMQSHSSYFSSFNVFSFAAPQGRRCALVSSRRLDAASLRRTFHFVRLPCRQICLCFFSHENIYATRDACSRLCHAHRTSACGLRQNSCSGASTGGL